MKRACVMKGVVPSMLDDLQESIETWLERSVMKSFPIPEEVVDAENKPGMIGT
jgi:hypothetical protein